MKTRIILACLAIMSILAHADELKELLGKKEVEYTGVCYVDKFGQVVFEKGDKVTLVPCIVGSEQSKRTMKYILLFDGNKPTQLIELDVKEMKQRVLWTRSMT